MKIYRTRLLNEVEPGSLVWASLTLNTARPISRLAFRSAEADSRQVMIAVLEEIGDPRAFLGYWVAMPPDALVLDFGHDFLIEPSLSSIQLDSSGFEVGAGVITLETDGLGIPLLVPTWNRVEGVLNLPSGTLKRRDGRNLGVALHWRLGVQTTPLSTQWLFDSRAGYLPQAF